MDCFLWKFLRTCLPFSSILLTLFFLMSLCRFKKTGIHLTTYLKCLTTPSCTRSNSPPKVWYQNHTKPVCSLSLWKYLRFQILALERIRSKQGHGAGSPGPINRLDSAAQTSKEPHGVGARSSRQSCHGPGTCEHRLKMCCISHTTWFSSVWLLSIFLRCKGRQSALCDLAFPVSWSNHDSYWRISIYTHRKLSAHTAEMHILGHHTWKRNRLVWETPRREDTPGNSFIQRQMAAEMLFSMLLAQILLGRKGISPSAVLCAPGGELVTLTSLFGPWLFLGNKWSGE